MNPLRNSSKAMKYNLPIVFLFFVFILKVEVSNAQCSATTSAPQNWTALAWTGCTPNPTTAGSTYNGNISISGLGNGETVFVNISLTITGNLTLSATGSNPTLWIRSGNTLRINGSLLNPNNNVVFHVEENAALIVDGTLNGGNGQVFVGSGTISGGTLNVGSASCSGSCPGLSFPTCSPSGFCQANNTCSSSVGGTVSTTTVGASTAICSNSSSPQLTLSGHTGSVVKWQSSIDGTIWSDISNTTAVTNYSPGTLTQTLRFRAVVQNSNCQPANSASITISVYSALTTPSLSNQTVCSGSNATFSITAVAGASYSWQVRNTLNVVSAITNNSNSLTLANVLSTQNGFQYRVTVTRCGSSVTSSYATLTVNTAAAGSITGTSIVCSGSSPGNLTLGSYTGSVIRWESSISPFSSWSTINHSSHIYNPGNLTETTHFRAISQNSPCSAVASSAFIVTVNALPAITTQPSANSICVGNTATFSVLATGTNISYQWQVNPGTGNFGNIALATSSTLNLVGVTSNMNNYQYRCVISGTCSPQVNSNAVTLTVNSIVTWTGVLNDNWHNPANWSCGVPTSFTDVIIPGSVVRDPSIYSGATCRNLYIQFKGRLSLNNNNSLTVLGDWTNEGDFYANNGTVVFSGIGDQKIGGNGESKFYNLQVLVVGGNLNLENNITIDNAMSLTSGLVMTNNYKVNFSITAISPVETSISRIVGTAEMELRAIGLDAVNFLGVNMSGSATDNIGNVSIVRYTGTKGIKSVVGNAGSIASTWHIEVSQQPSINGRDVSFSWLKEFDQIPLDLQILEIWKASSSSPNDWVRLPFAITAAGSDVRATSAINTKSFSHWTVTELSAPLPIKINNFNVWKNKEKTELKWQTYSDQDGYFSIQRSSDNKEFKEIKTIEVVKGIMVNYNTVDEKPFTGENYYRIKFVGSGEQDCYSSIVSVEFHRQLKISAFPNPFLNGFSIEFESFVEEEGVVVLINSVGEKVNTQNIYISEGHNSLEVSNVSNLKNGIYTVHVIGKYKKSCLKLIKI